jgi:hypothetical protein
LQFEASPAYLEKNPSRKKAGGMSQGVGPEFKLQHGEKNLTVLQIPRIT